MAADSTSPQFGQRTFFDDSSQFNAVAFLVKMMQGQQATSALVLVLAVNPSGIGPNIGTVSVQPMVNQIDSQGRSTPHGTIFNVPYMRIQGGANAIIMDPKIGDIGVAVFASRDISAVKATKAPANPGSRRRFSYSDCMYLYTVLGGTPTQYVEFTDAGINIVSPTAIIVTAPEVTVNAALSTFNGNVVVNGDLAAETMTETTTNVRLDDHVHSDSGGIGTGGPPVPGS